MNDQQIDVFYAKGPGAFEFNKNGIYTKYMWEISKDRPFIDLSSLKIEFNMGTDSFDDDSDQLIRLLRKSLDFELSVGNKKKYIARGDPSVLYSNLEFILKYDSNVVTLTSCSDVLFLNPRGGKWVVELNVIDTQFHTGAERENCWIGGVTLSLHDKWMDFNSKKWNKSKENHCLGSYESDVRVSIPEVE